MLLVLCFFMSGPKMLMNRLTLCGKGHTYEKGYSEQKLNYVFEKDISVVAKDETLRKGY